MTSLPPAFSGTSPKVQVGPTSGKIPDSVCRLRDLAYVERAIHRMLCGWGNQFYAWDDKIAVCRHVWDQACIVQRLRDRIDQFPGINSDVPVSCDLEAMTNVILMAPTFEDVIEGIFHVLNTTLVNAYLNFIEHVHSIHDAPTHQIIQEIVAIKDRHRRWRSAYRRQHPHVIDDTYLKRVEAAIASVNHLTQPLPVDDQNIAKQVGVNTDFRMRIGRVNPAWIATDDEDILACMSADFSEHITTRQLFWPIAYMRELGLAMDQLRWIYDSPELPWEFHYEESRHLWDESRHGDSGYSRMKDFGIGIEEVGFMHRPVSHNQSMPAQQLQEPKPDEWLTPMTHEDLYHEMFFIGLVAETGHFRVKREAYADFRDGHDLESAEMMLYDIIDETAHVQYAHKWLPVLAQRAGIDISDQDQRAAQARREKQDEENQRIEMARHRQTRETSVVYQKYMELLERLQRQCPLSNARTCEKRSPRPM